MRFPGYGNLVILTDPDSVRDVFRADNFVLHSGEGNEFLSAAVGKNSVLVLDGEPHARQRRTLLPPLRGERMRAFFGAMTAATRRAVASWHPGATLPALKPMQDITLEVMLRVVLGIEGQAEIDVFAGKVNRVLATLRARHGLILVKLLPIDAIQRSKFLPFQRRIAELDAAIFGVVERLRALPISARGDSIVAQMLAGKDESGQAPTDPEIRDAVLTVIIAGHDTTAIALAWAFEQIAARPDVASRIREEVDSVIDGGELREEHLDRLPYLDAVVRECLRIRTVLPFVVRLVKEPFTANGIEYAVGTLLCPCMHLVHRREDLFPEPQVFRPERFIERRYAAHEYFPFGGGGRTCLGMAFALFEMKVVLASVISRAAFVRPEGVRSVPVRRGIALAPQDGAVIRIVENRGVGFGWDPN